VDAAGLKRLSRLDWLNGRTTDFHVRWRDIVGWVREYCSVSGLLLLGTQTPSKATIEPIHSASAGRRYLLATVGPWVLASAHTPPGRLIGPSLCWLPRRLPYTGVYEGRRWCFGQQRHSLTLIGLSRGLGASIQLRKISGAFGPNTPHSNFSDPPRGRSPGHDS